MIDDAIMMIPSSTPASILTEEEILKEMAHSLPLWSLGSSEKVPAFLRRTFIAKDFQSALDCINLMGAIAESVNHHPNFHLTSYRQVDIELFTHDRNGVTGKDIALAKLLDEVKVRYSPKWLKAHPEAHMTAI